MIGEPIPIQDYEKIGESICKVVTTYLPYSNCVARLRAIIQKISSLLLERYMKMASFRPVSTDKSDLQQKRDENTGIKRSSTKDVEKEEKAIQLELGIEKNEEPLQTIEEENAIDLVNADLEVIEKEIIEQEECNI